MSWHTMIHPAAALRVAVLVCWSGVALAVERDAAVAPERAFSFTLDAAWMYGPVEGHVQTPSGGNPGTTSTNRPTLEELGIDNASIYDAELVFGWGPHEAFVGGQWFGMSEEQTLEDELVSQGITFPAGSRVDSDLRLDWYRVGYRYRIEAGDGPDGGPLFVIRPGAGFALLDYSFELDGPGPDDVDRSFMKGAPLVGAAVEWRISHRLSVAGEVATTIHLQNTPRILAAEVAVRYTLFALDAADVSLFAGIAYERIHYDHDQDVPNDIEIEAAPLLRLGVEARF